MYSPCNIILQAGIVHLSFKTIVVDIEWSDGRRVHCVLCQMHSPCNIILQVDIVHLSFKTTVVDIEWSDSRRVKKWDNVFPQSFLCSSFTPREKLFRLIKY